MRQTKRSRYLPHRACAPSLPSLPSLRRACGCGNAGMQGGDPIRLRCLAVGASPAQPYAPMQWQLPILFLAQPPHVCALPFHARMRLEHDAYQPLCHTHTPHIMLTCIKGIGAFGQIMHVHALVQRREDETSNSSIQVQKLTLWCATDIKPSTFICTPCPIVHPAPLYRLPCPTYTTSVAFFCMPCPCDTTSITFFCMPCPH